MSRKSTATLQPRATSDGPSPQAAEAPVNAALPASRKVELYTQMVRIRRFEERAVRAYQAGRIGGFCHTYIGQESVAVGTISVLTPEDPVITAYRDHGHALAVGMGMNECMAELYGRYTGCSKGKGGSMHYFDAKRNFWGGHGIVGGQTPLGAGLAFALKYLGRKACALCYLGDGAVNQGAFHEALNLAALWELPVIYVIENNFYSMGTSQARSSAGSPLARRAEGYGMNWDVVYGNDIYEVREKAAAAVDLAKEHSKPSLLEIQTYRFRGHSMSDPEKYRTKDEVEERKKQDPITLFRARLAAEGVLDDDTAAAIDKSAREEAEASARFAEESPEPPDHELFTDVYHDPIPDRG